MGRDGVLVLVFQDFQKYPLNWSRLRVSRGRDSQEHPRGWESFFHRLVKERRREPSPKRGSGHGRLADRLARFQAFWLTLRNKTRWLSDRLAQPLR